MYRIASYDNDSSDINDAASLTGSSVPPSIPPPALSPETFQTVTVPLCAEDAAAIYDLHLAYRNSLEVSEEEGRDLSRHHANLSDLVNIAELSVRRVIAMAKQVPAFRALPQVCLRSCLCPSVCLSVCFSVCWAATLQAISDPCCQDSVPVSDSFCMCVCLSAAGLLYITVASHVAYRLICPSVCL